MTYGFVMNVLTHSAKLLGKTLEKNIYETLLDFIVYFDRKL